MFFPFTPASNCSLIQIEFTSGITVAVLLCVGNNFQLENCCITSTTGHVDLLWVPSSLPKKLSWLSKYSVAYCRFIDSFQLSKVSFFGVLDAPLRVQCSETGTRRVRQKAYFAELEGIINNIWQRCI